MQATIDDVPATYTDPSLTIDELTQMVAKAKSMCAADRELSKLEVGDDHVWFADTRPKPVEIDGVDVCCDMPGATPQELGWYVRHAKEQLQDGETFTKLTVSDAGGGNVALDYNTVPRKFDRIRRITGYLVGTTDRWNNAKRAELCDRVKHC